MNKGQLMLAAGLLIASLGVGLAGSNVWYFDFGPENSSVMDGFIEVTPKTLYTPELGYGWRKAGVKGVDRKQPDSLARDLICGAKAVFKLNLAPGEYKVWVMSGDMGSGGILPIRREQQLLIQAKMLCEEKLDWRNFYSEDHYYAYLNSDYRAGEDVWTKYINPWFKQSTYPVKIKAGPMILKFRNMPINALIVYPKSMAAEAEMEISYLERRRRRQVIIEEVRPAADQSGPAIRSAATGDLVTFIPPSGKSMFPTTRPESGSIGKPVTFYASLGEFESGSFCVYPLKDVKAVRFVVTDLKTQQGRVLGKEAVDIRVVRYTEKMLSKGNVPEYRYAIVPDLLQKRDSTDLQKEVTRQVWITAAIPTNTAPGIYTGAIIIEAAGKPVGELPLKIRVLPFALADTGLAAGFYYLPYDYYYYYGWSKAFPGKEMEAEVWRQEGKTLQFLKQYGINTLAMCDDMRGQVKSPDGQNLEMNFNGRFGKWMDEYTKAGFWPMPWFGFQGLWRTSRGPGNKARQIKGFNDVEPLTAAWKKAFKQSIELTRDEVKKRKWSEIIFYIEDEASNAGVPGGEFAAEVAKLAREVPGVRTMASMNGPAEKVVVPCVTMAVTNHAFPITEETVKYIRDCGAELWLYNVGVSRFSFGFYPWRLGAKGRMQWCHRSAMGCPYNSFDGYSTYYFTMPTPEGTPLATLTFAGICEGLDDLRYIRTLEAAIAANANNANPTIRQAVADGKALLAEIRNDISVDIREYFSKAVAKEEVGDNALVKWTDEHCSQYRWRIAQAILKIKI